MAKFDVGQSVQVAFNPPRPDIRVPDQVNGKAPGRGDFKNKADRGVISGVLDNDNYLVEVELHSEYDRGDGKKKIVTSHRKRIISEAKLIAV